MSGSRYTVTRDRLADLKNNNNNGGSSDSTEAFGPKRGTGKTSPTTALNNQKRQSSSYELEEYSSNKSNISAVAKTDISTMEGFLSEVDDISNSIKLIQNNIDLISELHDSSLVSINEKQWKQNSKKLTKLVDDTSTMNNNIKNRIKTLESSNANHPQNSDLDIRRAQVGRVKKEFINCIQRYKDVESNFNQKYRQRVERQIKIVKQDVTEEELDTIIDSDQPNQIFAQSLLQNNRSGQAKAVLSEVQTRHDDIKKIQKTIIELAQLFQDMQMMVEQQGEVLTNIEKNTEDTNKDLEQGVEHVNKAIAIAKATRAKKWCCFIIFIIICIVIGILVWWFGFGHPGVGGTNTTTITNTSTVTATTTATSTASATASAAASATTTDAAATQ